MPEPMPGLFRYDKRLVPLARELRKNMTPEEKHLWYDCLSKAPVKFYRQRPVGDRCIADFFAMQPRLVIEVDGKQHYTEQGLLHDAQRDAYLNSFGLLVLHFTNDQIRYAFEAVCSYIKGVVLERAYGVPNKVPPPPGGYGMEP